jgi:hypothetical protein
MLPVFDAEDARLVGWEIGQADDGDQVLQARCEGCGTAYYLKMPPGAIITHNPPGTLLARDVLFGGPMKPPPARELPD